MCHHPLGFPLRHISIQPQRLREVARHALAVVQYREQRLPLHIHLQHHIHQHVTGGFIDAGKGLVQHHQRRLLYQDAGKQHALELAAGELINGG